MRLIIFDAESSDAFGNPESRSNCLRLWFLDSRFDLVPHSARILREKVGCDRVDVTPLRDLDKLRQASRSPGSSKVLPRVNPNH